MKRNYRTAIRIIVAAAMTLSWAAAGSAADFRQRDNGDVPPGYVVPKQDNDRDTGQTFYYESGKPVPKGYPLEFDGRGVIDILYPESIIISDSLYPITSFTTFNRPGRLNTFRDALKPGEIVGYKLDSQGRVVSLWQLDSLD